MRKMSPPQFMEKIGFLRVQLPDKSLKEIPFSSLLDI